MQRSRGRCSANLGLFELNGPGDLAAICWLDHRANESAVLRKRRFGLVGRISRGRIPIVVRQDDSKFIRVARDDFAAAAESLRAFIPFFVEHVHDALRDVTRRADELRMIRNRAHGEDATGLAGNGDLQFVLDHGNEFVVPIIERDVFVFGVESQFIERIIEIFFIVVPVEQTDDIAADGMARVRQQPDAGHFIFK